MLDGEAADNAEFPSALFAKTPKLQRQCGEFVHARLAFRNHRCCSTRPESVDSGRCSTAHVALPAKSCMAFGGLCRADVLFTHLLQAGGGALPVPGRPLLDRGPDSVDVVVVFEALEEITRFGELRFGEVGEVFGHVAEFAGDDAPTVGAEPF